MPFDVVIPTIGRPSLYELLDSLAASRGDLPEQILIVDDRRSADTPLDVSNVDERIADRVRVLRGNAAGPACARNIGWRASSSPYIAFLDDDVSVQDDWLLLVQSDIAEIRGDVAGSQANLHVPLPADRAPTDWERNVACLETAPWITADMIYRRDVLQELGGFDERFKRAYREDSDFALRAMRKGYTIARGLRRSTHPVRPADPWVSVRLQAGNADDVLMRALHGNSWRRAARAPRGRFPLHLLTVVSAATWAALTAEFAYRRIAPGPRTLREIATMIGTSVVIPFAAVFHKARGGMQLLKGFR